MKERDGKMTTKQQTKPQKASPAVVLAELEAQRHALLDEKARLDRELGAVSYEAHSRGNVAPEANARLDQAIDNIVRRDAELRSIDAAIEVASRHVEQAQAAEEQAQAREIAKELLVRADAIATHARELDNANAARIEAARALAEELELLRALGQRIGVHVPNHQQLLAMGSRAERTSMAQTPWAREVGEAIAPHEKRTHSSYAVPWRDQIIKAAAALMGDKQEAA
jgi:hypothetical protein